MPVILHSEAQKRLRKLLTVKGMDGIALPTGRNLENNHRIMAPWGTRPVLRLVFKEMCVSGARFSLPPFLQVNDFFTLYLYLFIFCSKQPLSKFYLLISEASPSLCLSSASPLPIPVMLVNRSPVCLPRPSLPPSLPCTPATEITSWLL